MKNLTPLLILISLFTNQSHAQNQHARDNEHHRGVINHERFDSSFNSQEQTLISDELELKKGEVQNVNLRHFSFIKQLIISAKGVGTLGVMVNGELRGDAIFLGGGLFNQRKNVAVIPINERTRSIVLMHKGGCTRLKINKIYATVGWGFGGLSNRHYYDGDGSTVPELWDIQDSINELKLFSTAEDQIAHLNPVLLVTTEALSIAEANGVFNNSVKDAVMKVIAAADLQRNYFNTLSTSIQFSQDIEILLSAVEVLKRYLK